VPGAQSFQKKSGPDTRNLKGDFGSPWDCTNVFFGHCNGYAEMRILLKHRERFIRSMSHKCAWVNDAFRHNTSEGRRDFQISFQTL